MHRPLLAGADDDRGDAGGLELLHGAEKIVPGLDVLGLHAGLLEQFLVVIEGDLADLERNADDLAVDLEGVVRRRGQRSLPRRDISGDVLEEARLVLRLHDAAAPAVEQLRARVGGLQHRRQLRLEGLVLQILELDLHAGMRGVVIVGDLLPNRLLSRVFADMKDGDVRIGVGRGAQSGRGRPRGLRVGGMSWASSGSRRGFFLSAMRIKSVSTFGDCQASRREPARKCGAMRLTRRRGLENNSASRRKTRGPSGNARAMKTADPELMRAINRFHVMDAIRRFGPMSRVEISQFTELSSTTVSAITAALLDDRLIIPLQVGAVRDAGRGRPRVMLKLNPDAAHVVGVKLAHDQITVAVTNFCADILRSLALPIRIDRQTASVIADLVEDGVRRCVSDAGLDIAQISGVCVGLPGVVERAAGICRQSPILQRARRAVRRRSRPSPRRALLRSTATSIS